jgi:hypothetical protein
MAGKIAPARSPVEVSETHDIDETVPDFAALYPGYSLITKIAIC